MNVKLVSIGERRYYFLEAGGEIKRQIGEFGGGPCLKNRREIRRREGTAGTG